jgi:hypothetical protein
MLEEFLEKTEYKESTKESYRKAFKTFEKLFKTTDFIELFTKDYQMVVATLQEKYPTNYNYWSKVNVLCKHYNIEYKDTPYGKPDKMVASHDIESARKSISNIDETKDLKAKVFLSLFTNKSKKAVRRDWATIQIKDKADPDANTYDPETGEFHFKELNKTYNSMKFVIEDTLKEMINKYVINQKYLYNYTSKGIPSDEGRVASFSEYVNNISLKYLGKRMGMNEFRQMIVQGDRDEIMNSDKTNTEKIKDLIQSAEGKDHSIKVEIVNYMESMDAKQATTEGSTEGSTEGTTAENIESSTDGIVKELQDRILNLEKVVGKLMMEITLLKMK